MFITYLKCLLFTVIYIYRYHLLPEAVSISDLRTLYSGKELFTLTDGNHFSVNITVIGEV